MSDSGFALSKDETTWAVVAHGLTFIEGGVIGPLVLYALKRDSSPFVAFHALQSFYFGMLLVLVSVCSCGILALPGVCVYLIFEFIACTRAASGEWYTLPIAGALALKTHPAPG